MAAERVKVEVRKPSTFERAACCRYGGTNRWRPVDRLAGRPVGRLSVVAGMWVVRPLLTGKVGVWSIFRPFGAEFNEIPSRRNHRPDPFALGSSVKLIYPSLVSYEFGHLAVSY